MKLDVLGLTDETERAYTALVGQPQCTASELAEACGLTAATVGRLLSVLVRDGLATGLLDGHRASPPPFLMSRSLP